jgi:hypothetical protein
MNKYALLVLAALVLSALVYLGFQVEGLRQTVLSQSSPPAEAQTHSLKLGRVVEDGKSICSTDALKADCTES